jgi:hypothetical protein
MNYGIRSVLMATLPAALVFAACQGRSGLSGGNPDSGTPVLPNPDADKTGPVNPNPDTAIRPADALSPDTEGVRLDTSLPPAGRANIIASPPSADFGVIDVGVTSAPITITVTNMGIATSGPLTVTVTGAGLTVFGCIGVTLAPQATCLITIRANPPAAGRIDGIIEVGDSAADSRKISVTGIAVTPGMQLTLVPSPLDLGSVLAGKTATGTIKITNTTLLDVTDLLIVLSGTGFNRSASGTCTDKLAMQQSCNFDVSFTAGSTSGLAKGTVTVSYGNATKSVAVTATVLAPAKLVMSPGSVSFQTTPGTPSSPATIYVANSGDVATTIPTVTITGTNKDDFSFISTCTKVLAGGASDSCQITVTYNPKTAAAASSSALLTVNESGVGGSSVGATLTGTVKGNTNPVNPVDLIPVDNTVSGWTIDASSNMDGSAKPMVASTLEEGTSLIDGGMEPFYADGFSPKKFIWQNYKNGSLPAAPVDSWNSQGATLMLFVFQLSSAAQASGLYQNLLKFVQYTRLKTATSSGWEEPTTPLVGAKSRMQDTGADWFVNFQKDEYYVEIRFSPSNGPAPDFTPGNLDLKKEALRFAQAVASRL